MAEQVRGFSDNKNFNQRANSVSYVKYCEKRIFSHSFLCAIWTEWLGNMVYGQNTSNFLASFGIHFFIFCGFFDSDLSTVCFLKTKHPIGEYIWKPNLLVICHLLLFMRDWSVLMWRWWSSYLFYPANFTIQHSDPVCTGWYRILFSLGI